MPEKRSPGAPASATGTRSNYHDRSRFSAIGASEQAAARAIGFGDNPAPHRIVLRAFRPLLKRALRGFATIELPCGLVLVDLPIFIGRDGPWVALPRRPILDAERRQKLDATGQPSFQAVAEWRTRDLADRFSTAVIEAIVAEHPRALDGTGR